MERHLSQLIVILACLSATSPAVATAQAGDVLVMNGKEYSILTNPLEPFLELNPERRPSSEIVSTGLWRGYVATWRIADGHLSVVKVEIPARQRTIDGSFAKEYRDATEAVFPGRQGLFAEWFTGHIVIPTGKLVEYVHMGYASTYKDYLLLRVEPGVVTKQWRLDSTAFEKFREAQLAAFSRTTSYQAEFDEMKKDGKRSDEEIRPFLLRYRSEEFLRTIYDDAAASSLDTSARE